jgi:hypothetical protein
MWTLVTLAGGWLLKHFTFEVAKYIALRALIIGVCLAIGPIVLFKGFSMIIQFLLNYTSSYIGGTGLEPAVVNIVGIGAYLAAKMKIAEGFSVFLSFLAVSFILRVIRVK